MGRLIIDGNKVYELDEACMERKKEMEQNKNRKNQKSNKKSSKISRRYR